ncbi:MAG TPA: hypothetical protein VND15_02425 [Candidatus Acidoferrales bacterium]|nr:hypothetical protein [Candidatus Acidoferrales bacterium]
MPEVVEVKLRRIGTSFGVIIPRRFITGEHEGSMISISILKKQRKGMINRYLGIAKGSKPFNRAHEEDRV